jgi:hypothetical protein
MQSSGYTTGECHDFQFQQSTGAVFTGYGSCGGLNFTSPLTETDQTTGTAQEDNEHLVRVFPNPLKDYLFIEATGFQSGDIRIYSLLGNLVYKGALKQDSQYNLDLTSLTNGVYLVRIILDDKKCSTYTIIKS